MKSSIAINQARRMTRNQNHDDDASSMKRIKTCDKGDVAVWSDVNHDILYIVMMRLGFLDFSAFNKVCKSWRSFALANKNSFLLSRPPWSVSISTDVKEKECYLEDFEGRRFKTILPQSAGRKLYGITCGYLVLFGRETKDYWLVNPITRHQLHFPSVPFSPYLEVEGVVVFSPLTSGWLFVILDRSYRQIWFSTASKGVWNYVSSTFPIARILAFKGKIYTLSVDFPRSDVSRLCELRLDPKPKLNLLKTKNFPKISVGLPHFVNDGENLYLVRNNPAGGYQVHELDFGEMKWMCHGKTTEEYAFFISLVNSGVVKRESWWPDTDKNRQDGINTAVMWYFPHEIIL